MNPLTTINHQIATARIAETDRRAVRGWRAAEAARRCPDRPLWSWADRRVVGALVAVLVGVAGWAR
ncbi:MAG TPA: hypothetical protein VH482_06520 [Thermomicrobiales bacterium]|jgi:hypothetical protein